MSFEGSLVALGQVGHRLRVGPAVRALEGDRVGNAHEGEHVVTLHKTETKNEVSSIKMDINAVNKLASSDT